MTILNRVSQEFNEQSDNDIEDFLSNQKEDTKTLDNISKLDQKQASMRKERSQKVRDKVSLHLKDKLKNSSDENTADNVNTLERALKYIDGFGSSGLSIEEFGKLDESERDNVLSQLQNQKNEAWNISADLAKSLKTTVDDAISTEDKKIATADKYREMQNKSQKLISQADKSTKKIDNIKFDITNNNTIINDKITEALDKHNRIDIDKLDDLSTEITELENQENLSTQDKEKIQTLQEKKETIIKKLDDTDNNLLSDVQKNKNKVKSLEYDLNILEANGEDSEAISALKIEKEKLLKEQETLIEQNGDTYYDSSKTLALIDKENDDIEKNILLLRKKLSEQILSADDNNDPEMRNAVAEEMTAINEQIDALELQKNSISDIKDIQKNNEDNTKELETTEKENIVTQRESQNYMHTLTDFVETNLDDDGSNNIISNVSQFENEGEFDEINDQRSTLINNLHDTDAANNIGELDLSTKEGFTKVTEALEKQTDELKKNNVLSEEQANALRANKDTLKETQNNNKDSNEQRTKESEASIDTSTRLFGWFRKKELKNKFANNAKDIDRTSTVGKIKNKMLSPFAKILSFFKRIGKFFNLMIIGIIGFLLMQWQNLTNIISKVGEWLSSIWTSIKDGISSVWTSIKDGISSIWTSITDGISFVWTSIKDGISSVWTSITDGISSVWTSFKNGISSVIDGISGIWTSIVDGVMTIPDTFMNIIDTIVKKVKNVISFFGSDEEDAKEEQEWRKKARNSVTDDNGAIDTTAIDAEIKKLNSSRAWYGGNDEKDAKIDELKKLKNKAMRQNITPDVPFEREKVPLPNVNKTKDYIVHAGDTLGTIAEQNGTTVEKLLELNNNIKEKDLIISNNKIKILESANTTEKTKTININATDTLQHIAEKNGTTVEKLRELNADIKTNTDGTLQKNQQLKIYDNKFKNTSYLSDKEYNLVHEKNVENARKVHIEKNNIKSLKEEKEYLKLISNDINLPTLRRQTADKKLQQLQSENNFKSVSKNQQSDLKKIIPNNTNNSTQNVVSTDNTNNSQTTTNIITQSNPAAKLQSLSANQ
jgi:LysM repeat protein